MSKKSSIKSSFKKPFHIILNKIASKSKNYQFYHDGYLSLKKENKLLIKKQNKLNERHKSLKFRHSSLKDKYSNLKDKNSSLKSKYSNLKEKNSSLRDNYADLDERYDRIKEWAENLKRDNTDVWAKLRSSKKDYNLLNKEHEILNNELLETEYAFKFNIASKIAKYENIHIMHNDKFNLSFINIFNEHFGSKKHFFIFVMKEHTKDYTEDSNNNFFGHDNILRINDMDFLDLSEKSIKRVILHGLFVDEVIDYLYNNPKVLQKCYWSMWGGDFYFTHDDVKSFHVKQNVKAYLNLIDADFEVASKKYDFKGEHYLVSYPSPISKKDLEKSRINKNRDFISVQICNSADYTIIEALNMIKIFKDKPLHVKVILSYGDIDYNEEIIDMGKNIFGDKFSAIMEYMPPEEFADVLADTDILILSQNRQQGLANIFAVLYLGGKVFIKKDVGTFETLTNEYGVKIYDTHDIINESFDEFIENKCSKENSAKVINVFDDEHVIKRWKKIFID